MSGKEQTARSRNILERLASGVVIGDGGYVFALEKRGYVRAGAWTPESTVKHPEGVRQLHREFLRAGSDVIQAFTFYASEDKLENRGNDAAQSIGVHEINQAACDLAKEVAAEGDALVLGGLSQTPTYLSGLGKEAVQQEFQKQVDVFIENNLDFILGEYFEHVEEAEWAVEVMKKSGKPIAITLCIGPEGDLHGIPAGECAVRLAKAGADIVGVNCHFGPIVSLETIRIMKAELEKANLSPYLMVQPLGYVTPDASRQGFIDLPEFPFALEPRTITRWEAQTFAREAYKLGVKFLGGCCGFEPYHIRALAEELSRERGRLPPIGEEYGTWVDGLKLHTKPWVRARASRSYWDNLKPASGRPFCSSFSPCDHWGVTQGHAELMQHKEATTHSELQSAHM